MKKMCNEGSQCNAKCSRFRIKSDADQFHLLLLYLCIYCILQNCTSKFSQLDTDILELCQKRENKLVRLLRDNLLKKKYITEEVYRESFPSGMDYQRFINLTVLLGLFFLLLAHTIIS